MFQLSYLPYIGLYFLQGAATAYVMGFQKPLLLGLGLTPTQLSWLSAFFFLPFILKIVVAHWSDQRHAIRHHRRAEVFFFTGLATCAFFLCSLWTLPGQFPAFLATAFLASIGLSSADAILDGLAVESTTTQNEGWVQSLMFSSRALGAILFSPLLGRLTTSGTQTSTFHALALTSLVALGTLFFIASPPMSRTPSHVLKLGWRAVAQHLKKSQLISYLLYAVLFSTALYGTDGLLTLFYKNEFSLTERAVGSFGLWKNSGMFLGALGAGRLHTRYSRAQPALWGLLAVALLSLVMAHLSTLSTLTFWGFLWGFSLGFASTGFVAWSMHLTPSLQAATFFSLFMATANVGAALGESLSLRGAYAWGFHPTFSGLTVLALIAAAALQRSRRP